MVGNYGHHPNHDGALYFVDEVLPLVREQVPDFELTLVGPGLESERVAQCEGVRYLGWQPSLEPLYGQARVAVAPLRYGAGFKGKILEALATGLPVVTTPVGAEGLELGAASGVIIESTPEELGAAVVRLLRDDQCWAELSEAGLAAVEARWDPAQLDERLVRDLRALGALSTGPVRSGDRGRAAPH